MVACAFLAAGHALADWRPMIRSSGSDFERPVRLPGQAAGGQRAFTLAITNGYGDCYRMNMLRDQGTFQAYRGVCSYRGFSLAGM